MAGETPAPLLDAVILALVIRHSSFAHSAPDYLPMIHASVVIGVGASAPGAW